MRRKFMLLGIDLFWVALSPLVALSLRHKFIPPAAVLSAVADYAIIGLPIGLLMIALFGLNRGVWRYTSLPDVMRIMVAALAIVLLTLFATFALSRLEIIPRSLPILQWFVLVAGMTGSRLAIRLWHEKRQNSLTQVLRGRDVQNVLLVGVNQMAELYLRCAAETASNRISIVGILAIGTDLPGRLLRSHKVLGRPEDLLKVARELEVHGAPLDRVVVVEPASRLSSAAVEALITLERSSLIKVDWIEELLGFGSHQERQVPGATSSASAISNPYPVSSSDPQVQISGTYLRFKRSLDLIGAVILSAVVVPVAAVVAVLVALNFGLPVVFWQKRPGKGGRQFKLYKFRTMRGAHDQAGNRIPDDERSSTIGEWLRQSRLDELPQLYNILVGEMSFVGPRPLLPRDQPDDRAPRLNVRPGLTGLAQVYGDRSMDPNDKGALDIWYIANASFWLDAKIMLRTAIVFFRGERLDPRMLEIARSARQNLNLQSPASRLLARRGGNTESVA